MAQYNRPTQKKVQRSDEFISFFDHMVRFFMAHQVKLVVLLLLILLGFSGYGLWIYYQGRQAKQVATLYEVALKAEGPEALADWRSLIEQNPPLSLKAVASLELGGRLAKAGDWKAAAEAFEETTEAKDPLIKNLGLWAAGASWENAGNLEAAKAAFEKLTADKKDPFYFHGRLGQARLLAQSAQAKAAEEILTELLSEEKGAPPTVQRMAQMQLLYLWLSS